jgi:hypothetical protein
LQSVAFDFIDDTNNNPLIIEMSYCFPALGTVKDCPGHWNRELNWIEGKIRPQDAILDDLINEIKKR